MPRSSASSRALTDHDEIRRWAEERGAKPACVRGTGDSEDIGMIRLDFPGYSGEEKLQEITWDEWFDKFDESGLALLVQETTARGQKSNFNKLVNRETVEERSSSSGRNGRGTQTHPAASQEEDYELSGEEIGDEMDMDEDIEEEERETASPRTGTARAATNGGKRRQQRTTTRATSGAKKSEAVRRSDARQTGSRRSRSTRQRSNEPRSSSKQRTQGSRPKVSRSSRTAKKAPARASAKSAASRGPRSSGSRRRAA